MKLGQNIIFECRTNRYSYWDLTKFVTKISDRIQKTNDPVKK